MVRNASVNISSLVVAIDVEGTSVASSNTVKFVVVASLNLLMELEVSFDV